MSSKEIKPISAEMRFRQAFERIKNNEPQLLPRGSAVTQNNVAREAGCDPSALKKSRFPALIREIRAYVELYRVECPSKRQANIMQRRSRRTLEERLADTMRQRDAAQSLVVSANRRIIELTNQVQSLQRQIDELTAPSIRLDQRS
ncbi:hypothetical protein [Burkholderia diffusa]|uniref:hypothetical protein n=1 Tax=Burkholderia diffusa TaxID=488732 RepID=UPI00075D8062|nr:hypothetical protein [Burkholderia diffusa]KVH42595.1 hypothetical protein WJ39_29710 [Burkholderia diffusa]